MERKNEKIILFPRTKERLVEEGIKALQAKRYHEALRFFHEAEQLGEHSFHVKLSIVVCFCELGEFSEAEHRCRMLLRENGEDVELLQMYLSILMQLRRYEQAETVIRQALRRHSLPSAVREHLLRLLHFSRQMNERRLPSAEQDSVQQLLSSSDITEHMKVIKRLENEDITPVLFILKQYLLNKANNPITKTMVLRLLTSKNVSDVVTVEKFGKTMEVIPAKLNERSQTTFALNVLRQLENKLASKNPSLYEVAVDIWLRYTYILYPFLPDPASLDEWVAALHLAACQFQGMRTTSEKIAHMYHVQARDIDFLCKKLYEAEKISYF
ncbi:MULTISPECIES: tetratricopeptide repeat protein [Parageobacillus]|nr:MULTISPECIES: tetratricopeptide repeat protein [Parageobacillus]BDG46269.1 TPR repeat-containing protein YsoA [Parageobacillus sp. KH3-4]